MHDHFDFLTQTQLGQVFGASSHVIGKWLTDIGLRKASKRPTDEAIREGYCVSVPTGRGEGYSFFTWHREKTIAALKKAGHIPLEEQQQEKAGLVGPFEARQSSTNGYEIAGGDGTVAVWVMGEKNTRFLVRLLNRVYNHGYLQASETTRE